MNDNQEVWKTIDGYNNYEVSSFGRIRNNITFIIIKQRLLHDYPTIIIGPKKQRKNYSVHRLVAFAYCDNYDESKQVDHIDRNKQNNHYLNLRWVSNSINCKNRGIRNDNVSGHIGVCFDAERNKWIAFWRVDKKMKKKRFKTMDEALCHRKLMEIEHEYNAE